MRNMHKNTKKNEQEKIKQTTIKTDAEIKTKKNKILIKTK